MKTMTPQGITGLERVKLAFAHAVHTGIIQGQRMMFNIPLYLVAVAHSRVQKESTVTAVLTIHHTVLQL
jgi:hypothetical protein